MTKGRQRARGTRGTRGTAGAARFHVAFTFRVAAARLAKKYVHTIHRERTRRARATRPSERGQFCKVQKRNLRATKKEGRPLSSSGPPPSSSPRLPTPFSPSLSRSSSFAASLPSLQVIAGARVTATTSGTSSPSRCAITRDSGEMRRPGFSPFLERAGTGRGAGGCRVLGARRN